MFHQNPVHRLRRCCEEVRPILLECLSLKPEVDLVDKPRGSQSVPEALLVHVALGHLMKFFIDALEEFVLRLLISIGNLSKKSRQVSGRLNCHDIASVIKNA